MPSKRLIFRGSTPSLCTDNILTHHETRFRDDPFPVRADERKQIHKREYIKKNYIRKIRAKNLF